MSAGRKILFSLVTLLVLLGALEGVAQLVWWRLQERAFAVTKASGEKALRNDAINFMKQADGTFGYVLKPGFERGGTFINADGFAQRGTVPLTKKDGTLRLAALGESTTQGHHVDEANYPVYLHRRIKESQGGKHVEMINGGVSGWISDQVALWADKKVAAYQPDIVVLYIGWNDFQTYDPFSPPPPDSWYDRQYGSARIFVQSTPLKLIALGSAAYGHYSRKAEMRKQKGAAKTFNLGSSDSGSLPYRSTPSENYRFFLRSLDRIVTIFQGQKSKVHLAICTLVGRWPDGTEADYKSDQGATWWMKHYGLRSVQAAMALERFNELIRDYAKAHGLVLIDAASSFANLDRGKLQWDFAHLTPEGYELLAEVIYDGLRRAAAVNGAPSARLTQLRTKYQVERKLPGTTQIVETK